MWNLPPRPARAARRRRLAAEVAGGGGAAVAAGTYMVTLAVGGKKLTRPVTVLEDVGIREER